VIEGVVAHGVTFLKNGVKLVSTSRYIISNAKKSGLCTIGFKLFQNPVCILFGRSIIKG
jgi:hypothetical protein